MTVTLQTTAFSSSSRSCLHRPGVATQCRARTQTVARSLNDAKAHFKPQTEPAAHNRRSLLLGSGALLGLAPWLPAVASEETASSVTTYTDPQDGFTLTVPSGWAFGEGAISGNKSFSGASGSRRTLAWFPEGGNARDVNATLVITNVSVEFTKMGSFGSALTFGSSLVNSQDRSYLLRAAEWARGKDPIQIAKLVDATEAGGMYYVEYTVQKLPEPQRHLYSVVALGNNGTYNRLYTLTGQALEEERPRYEAALTAMVRSLSVPPART